MGDKINAELYNLLRAGAVLADKYRVERTIGVGGFGVVLAATHIHLEERIAIKLLLPEAAANAEASERFLREAKAAVKIKSEHVAKVTDVGVLPNGLPFMVMEYLEGSDLSKLVKQRGAQPIADVVEWVLQCCEALAEAHASGIIHRDLKPANLFLTWRADGSPSVKLLDFGISKVTPLHGDDKGMTKTSDVMGSPYYMSPEQMKSTRNVDARSDIWALGTILFEVIGGVPPFDGETMPALLAAILQEPPRDIDRLRSDMPPALKAVILKCLEKSPAARFASVAELAVALAPFGPPRAHASVQRIVAVASGAYRPVSSGAGPAAQPPSALSGSQPQSLPHAVSSGDLAVASGATEPGMGPPIGAAASGQSGPSLGGASASWGATVGATRSKSRAPALLAAGVLGIGALAAVGVFVVGPRLRTDVREAAPASTSGSVERPAPAASAEAPVTQIQPEVSAEGDPTPKGSAAAAAGDAKKGSSSIALPPTPNEAQDPAAGKLGGGKLGGGKVGGSNVGGKLGGSTPPPPPPPPSDSDLFGKQD